ncbi:Eukaryotic translation initiation factor 5A [Taenia crassiceps]|uniref:Eukaryotic translation initiation factor 5A n=1 Tax=Taenia crassiceps TaxID=6207 RepID=A0ABR4QSM1_9CEST
MDRGFEISRLGLRCTFEFDSRQAMGDEEFSVGDAGASMGAPIQCGAIKKNAYVIIKDRPCKIVEVSASKTGKHGSAKINYVGIDIFSGKRLEECRPSGHTVISPNVTRTECQLVSIDPDGFLELLMADNTTRSDIHGSDMLDTLKEKFENLGDNEDLLVTYISAMGQEKVVECRINTNK